MATNDFKPFAAGAGANVMTQADWVALAALVTGFQSGKASSAQVNKALRQGTVMASVLGQFVANNSGANVLDNGDTATILTNLTAALKSLLLSRANPFGDIKTDGAAAIATALANLGLGLGSLVPVGSPIPWATATPPTGYLKLNGASFSGTQYPGLALAYPSLVLPDLRGEFIRGWDDGRGIDSGRGLLSAQLGTFLPSIYTLLGASGSVGTLVTPPTNSYPAPPSSIMPSDYDSPNSATGAYLSTGQNALTASGSSSVSSFRVRPRNLAFSYIVRAA